jgi:hypothetical protein
VRKLVELMDSPDQVIADAATSIAVIALWEGSITGELPLSASQRGFLRDVFEAAGLWRPLH